MATGSCLCSCSSPRLFFFFFNLSVSSLYPGQRAEWRPGSPPQEFLKLSTTTNQLTTTTSWLKVAITSTTLKVIIPKVTIVTDNLMLTSSYQFLSLAALRSCCCFVCS